ncbi:hypothetical protein [Fictibacillus barbaricus]|uniref:CorA-like Mg2+ transporter protein n=1 Tax=Fictibacillus barbaricus TaxID=182136 RepID=A0ABU1U448_9BACL|nr:hypothetical protein [Fictibacillus barbaricus]MDR7074203.1 hypothetical protein [Fictibacillus barbaricus]
MFYKIFNIYSIINFSSENYEKIISDTRESYAYVAYIDTEKGKGTENNRYSKYINLKQGMYTRKVPTKKKEINGPIYTIIDPNISKYDKEDVAFADDQPIGDDYYYEKQFIKQDDIMYTINHIVNPVERHLQHLALDTEEYIQNVDDKYLKKEQLETQMRFSLIPFIAKIGGEFIEPTVIATFYKQGIVTLNIMISSENKKVPDLKSDPESNIIFDEVEFLPIKKSYYSKDYWQKKVKRKNIPIHEVLNHYEKWLKEICSSKLITNDDYKPTSWVLCDFEKNKNPEHKQFVNNNKQYYFGLLRNSGKHYVSLFNNETIVEEFKASLVSENKYSHFYCNETTSILSIGYMLFYETVKDQLKENETQLKKENMYDSEMNNIFKELAWHHMYEFLRFYELTFIKKFYLRNLLNNLNTKVYHTLSEYNSVKRDLNFIKLLYDEESIFLTDGSPKKLYCKLEEKTKTSHILSKVESMFSDLRDDIDKNREFEIKKNESFIFIVSSLLTVLLAYNGLKFITIDILGNLPIVGEYVDNHPLRWTIVFWLLLVGVMFFLNIRRQKSFNK